MRIFECSPTRRSTRRAHNTDSCTIGQSVFDTRCTRSPRWKASRVESLTHACLTGRYRYPVWTNNEVGFPGRHAGLLPPLGCYAGVRDVVPRRISVKDVRGMLTDPYASGSHAISGHSQVCKRAFPSVIVARALPRRTSPVWETSLLARPKCRGCAAPQGGSGRRSLIRIKLGLQSVW